MINICGERGMGYEYYDNIIRFYLGTYSSGIPYRMIYRERTRCLIQMCRILIGGCSAISEIPRPKEWRTCRLIPEWNSGRSYTESNEGVKIRRRWINLVQIVNQSNIRRPPVIHGQIWEIPKRRIIETCHRSCGQKVVSVSVL